MVPIRRRARWSSGPRNPATSAPSRRRLPLVGCNVRFRIRNSVVFPLPLGPMKATCSPRPMVRETPSRPTDPSRKRLRTSPSSYITFVESITLFEKSRRDRCVLDTLPIGVVGFDVFLRPVEVEQPPILRIAVVELQERVDDPFLELPIKVTPHRPYIIDVGWRRVEHVHLGEIDLLLLDELVPHEEVQCARIDLSRLNP